MPFDGLEPYKMKTPEKKKNQSILSPNQMLVCKWMYLLTTLLFRHYDIYQIQEFPISNPQFIYGDSMCS